ncbi:MAG: PD-(D/E)XK nuclease family protein, partial [Proteobacteria bacterium]|nr:PD-(D/E)XK nuclease family protein [Pseudomonadota bacterium]
ASASGKQALTHNFRSTPAYLRALNALYESAGSHAFAQAGIDYEPMQPGSDAADDDLSIDGKSATPLTFWRDTGDSLQRTSKAKAEPRLAAACASAIFDLLIEGRAQLRDKQATGVRPHRPLRPADLAVLVATNDQAHAVWKALSDRGIASASVLSSSVFASEEAGELHTLLDALVDFDEARLRGALATRLFGKTAKDFVALAVDAAAWRGELDALAELRRIWQTRGITAMLQSVFEQRAARVLGTSNGERRMTNWLQLAELAQTASHDGVGLRGLVDWLALRITQADKDNEDEQLRLESDADRVKIFTLHKSKGLEFPVVFLPFAGLRHSATKSPYEFHDNNDATALFVALDATPQADAAKQAATNDAFAEDLRKLYVALTRARCATYVAVDPVGSQGNDPVLLHLLGVEDRAAIKNRKEHTKKKAEEISALHSAHLSQRLDEVCGAAKGVMQVAALPPSGKTRLLAASKESTFCARTMPRRVRDDWRIASYSRLADGAPREVRGGGDDEGLSSDSDVAPLADVPASVLRGPRFGTAFHELIEATDFHAWRDGQESGVPASQRALVERIVRRHALTPERQAVTALGDLVARTLRAPLPIGARLIDLAPGAYRAEMSFHLALAEVDTSRWLALLHEHGFVENRSRFEPSHLHGLMHGILDLVVLHEGRWWVVDYKTNLLRTPAPDAQGDASPYAPAALERAVRDDEYDLQYVIYLMALH